MICIYMYIGVVLLLHIHCTLYMYNTSGSVVGDALTNHPDVRKLGFTGSTEVGKEIMRW